MSDSDSSSKPKSAPLTPAAVRKRQMILLAIIGGGMIGAIMFGMKMADQPSAQAPVAAKPAVTISTPGAQVEPKDAWMGQASAELNGLSKKSDELSRRGDELTKQSEELKHRMDEIAKMGAGQAASGAPAAPGSAMPPGKPSDASAVAPAAPGRTPASAGKLPPAPPPPLTSGGAPVPPLAPPKPERPTGIVSVVLNATASAPAGAGSPAAEKTGAAAGRVAAKTIDNYMPPGFVRAVFLGGLDAPTGGQAQSNPQPVLLRLVDSAVLPNKFRFRVKDAFVIGAGFGDLSSERANIRLETLSMVLKDGTVIELPIKGYVAGEDGKSGVRGRLVEKQGQILANALVAGVASGIGSAFQQSSVTQSVSPLGSTSTVMPGQQFQAGIGNGVGKALDRLAQYYISLADKVFPIIEVDAGRMVDVVFTKGVEIDMPGDESGTTADFMNKGRGSNRWMGQD